MANSLLNRTLLISVVAILALLLGVMYTVGTTTFADALRGYEIMEQFSAGGEWNSLSYPSVDNPTYSYYVAWWSPGQWVVPWIFMSLLSIESFQVVQALIITICLPMALIGYGRLFTKLGFNKAIVYASLLCIVTNQLFYWHTMVYYGGDLLMLSIFPFFLLSLLKVEQRKYWVSLVVFFLFGLIGTFFKNTFLIVMIASLAFIFLRSSSFNVTKRLGYFLPFLIVAGLAYFFHISLGETPSSAIDIEGYNGIPNDLVGDLTYAIGSPANTFFRFDSLMKIVFQLANWSKTSFNYTQIIPVVLTILVVLRIVRKQEENDDYKKLLIVFSGLFFLAFIIMFLMDRAVSYELRHFAPVAFLFFPGILKWILSFKWKKLLITGVVLISLFDLGLYYRNQVEAGLTYADWKTLRLPVEEVEIKEEIERWSESNDGLVLIENRWQLAAGLTDVNKIVIRQKEYNFLDWYVSPGMELENVDCLVLNELEGTDYKTVLFVHSRAVGFPNVEEMTSFSYVTSRPIAATASYQLIEFVIN
ncbi:MAG: hypothetical protein QNK23_06040 [Crocinitomicaceae bacterium]|nr:hypothetical protein [Crocinitomicaceae bacterium]